MDKRAQDNTIKMSNPHIKEKILFESNFYKVNLYVIHSIELLLKAINV
jgi:hypothetical protein